MSDSGKQIGTRQGTQTSARGLTAAPIGATSPARLETLRRMVAAGQYRVNARYLAREICRAARLPVTE